MIRFFTQHPHSVGETYLEHLRFAGRNGFKLFAAGVACMIHSILPFMFARTASNAINEITQEMAQRKNTGSE